MIEVRNNLNNKNIVLLLLLSVATSSLFNIGLVSNVIHTFLLFLLIYSLFVLNKYKSDNLLKQFTILISFLPLTLISTLNFPSPRPWLRQSFKTSAETGIRNKLKPGDISNLAQSEDLVARVYFSNGLPEPENRYWRVYVLDDFKNNTWIPNKIFDEQNITKKINLISKPNSDDLIKEKWILEPNFIRQRPWSGKGNPKNINLKITDKGILLSKKELQKRDSYQMIYTKNSWRGISPEKTTFNISEIKNKSLYKLSRKWLNETSNTNEILKKAKVWFSKGEYTYSINPGVMSEIAPYDEFLFQKKKGFCEHFAGSFALLMKYANIPSRVIIGFQGGEVFKDFKGDDYILIDNSYAHAWNEIWIEEKGWVRIDPTSWVSPERIQDTSLVNNKDKSIIKTFIRNVNIKYISNLTRLDQSLTYISDKINLKFAKLNFSENTIINRIFIILLFSSTLLFTIFTILLMDSKKKNDFLRINLNIYLYLLRCLKLKKEKAETLKSYSLRVKESYPQKGKEIRQIYGSYNSYKFGNKKFTKIELLRLSIKMTFYQIKVLTHIASENCKSNLLKFIGLKE